MQSKIPDYGITGFTKQWNDGKALNALIDALHPGLAPNHASLPGSDAERCGAGIDLGHDTWGVPKLLDAEDLANPKVDEHSVMAYISYYRDIDPSKFVAKKGEFLDVRRDSLIP